SEIEPHRRNSNRGTSRGTFKFSNASVINGAQTVSTLGEVFKNCDTQQDLIEKLRLIKVPARFIKVNDNDNTEIASLITRANNHQNRVLGRDFASQHVEQIRLARELVVEGYKYQLLRTDNQSVIMDENAIDLDEALNGLACLTLSPSVLATLKTQRGKFFDNLDGALYRQIFNPSVSGVKLINSVRHLRCIESLISSKLDSIDRYENSKRHLIVTHGNRVFSAILLNKVCNIINANDVVVPDSNSISYKLDLVIGFAEEFIESNYSNAYPARFFGNVEKVTEIISAIINSIDWRA
ncbi:AIPR family protein, partial [Aeromonas caviae]